MDFLKAQFERIQQQLGGLSTSQKLLSATLVAIMVMTLVWWGRYAASPEREALLSQSLTDEEINSITPALSAAQIDYSISSDKKILVAADRKVQAMAALGFAEVLPKDMSNGLDEMIKQVSPWDGGDKQSMMFNRGKELLVGDVIRHFPGVASATVAIDPTYDRAIGTGNVEPSAFVNIRMKPGATANKKLVNAAASIVKGAQSRVPMKNIRVVVDGVPQHVHDAEDPENGGLAADNLYEQRQIEETRLTRKVAEQLAEIQGVMVSVTVAVNNRTTAGRMHSVDKVDNKESTVDETSKETTGAAPPAPAEAGATPNVGAALAAPVSAEASHTETQSKVTYQQFPSTKDEEWRAGAGEMTPSSASVRVPRSYFARIAKGTGTAEPDEAAIRAKISEELPHIQEVVASCAGLKSIADVKVVPYFDQAPLAVMAPQPAAASAVSLALTGHAKEIALSALALISLFLVSTIVKRGTPAPAPAPAPVRTEPSPVLSAGEMVAGEAGVGDPMLDGMELDDDAVRTQQMIDQVSTMVQENPDAAASLVKRWLNRS